MSHSVTDTKSEEDYYGGPPPPDEVLSSKPKVPAYGTTPMKPKTDPNATVAANVSPESIQPSNASVSYSNETAPSLNYKTGASVSTPNKSQECKLTYTLGRGEKSFFVSKIIPKINKKTKEQNLTLKVNALQAYAKVNDDPRTHQIAKDLLSSDLIFLEVKEVNEDDIEPRYELFGENQPLCKDHAAICSDWKINNNCDNCYADCCNEWCFGQYCVSAVKRYYAENEHSVTVKDAYVTFVAHYNRVLDWHSYGEGHTHKLRKSQITKPPYCMKKGSLLFAIQWIKWQIENGSEKEHYAEQRRKRKIVEKEKEAERENRKKEFKTVKNPYRYGGRKRY